MIDFFLKQSTANVTSIQNYISLEPIFYVSHIYFMPFLFLSSTEITIFFKSLKEIYKISMIEYNILNNVSFFK